MPESHQPPGHSEVRYEKSDAWIGGVIAFGVMLALLVIVAQVSSVWLFDGLKNEGHADQAKGSLKKAVDRVAETVKGHNRSNERA